MRKKTVTFCEVCGDAAPSGPADFLIFHCLTFCSSDCRDDYRAADEARRAKSEMRHTRGPTKAQRSYAA